MKRPFNSNVTAATRLVDRLDSLFRNSDSMAGLDCQSTRRARGYMSHPWMLIRVVSRHAR